MASLLQKFFSMFKPKQIRKIELDPESVREHNMIRALANENAELKAEISRRDTEEGKKRIREEDVEEEEKVKWELNKQKKQIEKKEFPKYFSLMGFCRKLYGKNFKDKVYFTSFDGSTRLAKFGDIGISEGSLVLVDNENRIVISGKTPNDIFWSVGALDSDLQAFRIPLCMDKGGDYIENIMTWEAPELIPTKGGKFRYSKVRKKPLYEFLKENMATIQDLHEQVEEKELTISELQKENDILAVSQRVAEDDSETSRSELGQAEKTVSSITRIFRGTEKELSQLRDTNNILEENVDKLEREVEKLREEAERQGVKLSDDRALERIQQIRRELVRDEPTQKVKLVKEIQENM